MDMVMSKDKDREMSKSRRRAGGIRARLRHALLALAVVALALPLAACDRWSSSCDFDASCHIEMSGGETSHEMPRPLDADEGVDHKKGHPDLISIVEATAGGTATLIIGDEEHVCAVGESFTIVDTTITCTEIGDDSIVLDTVREG